jgi:hypothetical protein
MEDKWFVFYEAPWLWFHRSWTGSAIYGLRLSLSEGGSRVDEAWVNREPERYSETDDAYDPGLLAFLVEALLLGRDAPFPERSDVARPMDAALLMHHVVGHARSNADVRHAGAPRGGLPRSDAASVEHGRPTAFNAHAEGR